MDTGIGKLERDIDLSFVREPLFDATFESSSVKVAAGGNRLTVSVALTIQEVEKLEPVWNSWPHSLDTTFEYYLHTMKRDPTVLRPYVVTVYSDGIAQAMLLGHIGKRRAYADISFLHILGPKARVLEITKGGRLGCQSATIDKLIASVLLGAVKSGEVDFLCFQRLPLHAELYSEIRKVDGFLFNSRVSEFHHYSTLHLQAPTESNSSIFPRKLRHEARRKTRILHAAFPGKVHFHCYSQPGELGIGIHDAISVLSGTWQSFLGCSRLNTPETQEKLKFFAQQGWLRVFVLYIGDRPCAFFIGQLVGDKFYCHDVGCDRRFVHYSIGFLLTAWAFEELASIGVRHVDLGDGDQEYKRRIGCQRHEEGTVHVYSRTLRGVCVNAFIAVTNLVRDAGRRALSGSRRNWLVKLWRQFARWQYGKDSEESLSC